MQTNKIKLYALPGLMNDYRLWSKIKSLLDDRFELIHIPIILSKDFDSLCEELDKIIKDNKINLLGFSFGSYIAAYYAIKNPKKINKLFLVAGCASFLNEEEMEKRKRHLVQINHFGFKGLSTKKVLSLIEKKNQTNDKLINLIKNMFSKLGKDTYIKQLNLSFKRKDLSDKIVLLDIPIFIIYSKDDKLFDYNALDKIKKANKQNINLFEIEGKSHFIPLEYPEYLVDKLTNL